MRDVSVDRASRDEEAARYVWIGKSLADQAEDPQLGVHQALPATVRPPPPAPRPPANPQGPKEGRRTSNIMHGTHPLVDLQALVEKGQSRRELSVACERRRGILG